MLYFITIEKMKNKNYYHVNKIYTTFSKIIGITLIIGPFLQNYDL